jgi:hypothetical protein
VAIALAPFLNVDMFNHVVIALAPLLMLTCLKPCGDCTGAILNVDKFNHVVIALAPFLMLTCLKPRGDCTGAIFNVDKKFNHVVIASGTKRSALKAMEL